MSFLHSCAKTYNKLHIYFTTSFFLNAILEKQSQWSVNDLLIYVMPHTKKEQHRAEDSLVNK